MPALEPPSAADLDTVYAAAKATDPDRFASALLAPRQVRDDLVALAAFSGEVRKVASSVHEPHMGEVRLQWWRETLTDGLKGSRSGYPVADAFAGVMQRHDLDFRLVSDHLDACAHRLYAEPPPDQAALQLEHRLGEGAIFAMAARILNVGDAAAGAAVEAAGQTYGTVLSALYLPMSLARGRSPLPPGMVRGGDAPDLQTQLIRRTRMHLAQAKPLFNAAAAPLQLALLPLALVEPYLAALEKPGRDSAHQLASISPFTRMMCLALAHWRKRI